MRSRANLTRLNSLNQLLGFFGVARSMIGFPILLGLPSMVCPNIAGWNIPIFSRKYMEMHLQSGSIFHCCVGLPECVMNVPQCESEGNDWFACVRID